MDAQPTGRRGDISIAVTQGALNVNPLESLQRLHRIFWRLLHLPNAPQLGQGFGGLVDIHPPDLRRTEGAFYRGSFRSSDSQVAALFTLMGLVLGLIGDLMYVAIDPRIDFAKREG